MAAPASRLERLVRFIGEENLPPKLPAITVTPVEELAEAKKIETSPVDPIDNLQTADDFIKEQEGTSENWWDALPTQTKAVKVNKPQSQQAKPATMSYGGEGFEFDERCGDKAPLGISFAPFQAVTKLPCK